MSQIWVLRPRAYSEDGEIGEDNLWSGYHGRTFGFVIRAESEDEARQRAQENGGQEVIKSPAPDDVHDWEQEVWTDPKLTICVPIDEYAEQFEGSVLMIDHRGEG